MTDKITNYLAEQKRLAEAATEGPWAWHSRQTVDGDSWAVFDSNNRALASNGDGWTPDAEFIAAARESVPRLVAALEAVVAIRGLASRPGDAPHVLSSIAGYNRALTVVRAAVEAALGGEGR